MSAMNAVRRLKDQVALYWMARTEQERRFLGAGGAVVVLALVYSIGIDPALSGREKLSRELPVLRQQAATLQALAQEAGDLARQPPPQVTPMTRENLTASLATRSIKPEQLTVTGEYVKLQVNGVSFANLYTWIDAQRRESRIMVFDAGITAATGANAAAGQVDAVLTLRQDTSQANAGPR